MALAGTGREGAGGGTDGDGAGVAPRPARLRHFARLKLRLLAGGFRGRPGRVVSVVAGALFGLYLAGLGFFLFAAGGALDPELARLVAAFGGALLVAGSAVLPLVWFGVDDTLDPARFALLPLSRWQLVRGLLVASLVGVPGVALLVATTGLLVPAAVHGGTGAVALQAAGVVAGLLLCLATARAVTSAFAGLLRSRRVRDLAWVLIATLAALLGPLQLVAVSAVERAEWERLAAAAEVLGWTPLASAYTVGIEVALGRPWAAAGKLAITALSLVLVLWWWSRTLEPAMAGATTRGADRGATRGADRAARSFPGGVTAQLLPRWLPGLRPGPFGALVAHQLRYWWRDARRRSSLIVVVVISLFLPTLVAAGARGVPLGGGGSAVTVTAAGPGAPVPFYLTALFTSVFASSMLANQFGYDGTAYGAHLAIGVPGRRELRARAAAYSVVVVPLLLVVGLVLAVLQRSPALAPAAWGVLAAGYGAGLAVNTVLSVYAPYSLPETSNPFATGSGDAVAKSALALLGLVCAGALAAPVLVAAVLLGDAWPWVGVPVGAATGAGLVTLATALAGDRLDRRAPELLAAVTPRR